MLNIEKTKDGECMKVALEGRLDTSTSPEFESSIKEDIEGVKERFIDLEKLDYISSAGLRVLLATQKLMNKQGRMVVKNPNSTVMEIFDVTGFADLLTIE